MRTAMRATLSTHYYWHDPDTGRCRQAGLHGAVCGLPKTNRHHIVPAVDPAVQDTEARRLGEREENQ